LFLPLAGTFLFLFVLITPLQNINKWLINSEKLKKGLIFIWERLKLACVITSLNGVKVNFYIKEKDKK